MIYVVADHHLGDHRLSILGRPYKTCYDMCDDIINKHNEVVKEDDTVLFVGDVVSSVAIDKEFWLEKVKLFNGKRKILIRGNHDRDISDEQFLKYFDKIIPEGDGIEMSLDGIGCWITHYPTRGKKELFNICGHIHSAWKVQKNAFNCGLDANHFFPTPETKISFYLNAITNFYDEDVWCYNRELNKSHEYRGKKGNYFDNKYSKN